MNSSEAMSIDDIIQSIGKRVWLEADLNNKYRCYAFVCGNKQSRVYLRTADNELFPLKKDYGKRWKCWTSEPAHNV